MTMMLVRRKKQKKINVANNCNDQIKVTTISPSLPMYGSMYMVQREYTAKNVSVSLHTKQCQLVPYYAYSPCTCTPDVYDHFHG